MTSFERAVQDEHARRAAGRQAYQQREAIIAEFTSLHSQSVATIIDPVPTWIEPIRSTLHIFHANAVFHCPEGRSLADSDPTRTGLARFRRCRTPRGWRLLLDDSERDAWDGRVSQYVEVMTNGELRYASTSGSPFSGRRIVRYEGSAAGTWWHLAYLQSVGAFPPSGAVMHRVERRYPSHVDRLERAAASLIVDLQASD